MPYAQPIGQAIRGSVSFKSYFSTNLQLRLVRSRARKGVKLADLPVVQSSKFELVINHQTAQILGLTVPHPLSGCAEELIE
jgi:putative tryptophan/tyrosine transport system substrate-binding protein